MKAFIYDMDGVIVDSEPVHMAAEMKLFEKLGVKGMTEEKFHSYQGSSDLNAFAAMRQDFHLKEDAATLAKTKKYLFDKMMHEQGATPIPGVLGLIERTHALREKGLKTAIASSSDRAFIEFVTGDLGITDKFDLIESGAELPLSKPDPAIYLKTAADLMVAPADCVVIEDTTNGVKAAKAAGMYCIGFISPHSGKQDLSLADKIVDNMDDVQPTL